MRNKAITSENQILLSEVIKLERRKTTKWYLKAFYLLGPIPVLLSLEMFFKSEGVILLTNALIVACIMIAAIIYCRAMFKAYHHLIYCDAEFYEKVQEFQNWKLILIKLVTSVVWLSLFALLVSLFVFLHIKTLQKIPDEIISSVGITEVVVFIEENFGHGIYLFFSMFSIFLQAVTLISITYLAASTSHVKFCVRYKTLAGIFVFVVMYYFENDFALVLKRTLIGLWGGAANVLETDGYMYIFTAVETFSYILLISMNVVLACYMLKNKYKE